MPILRFRLSSIFTGRYHRYHQSRQKPAIDPISSDNYDRLRSGLRTFTVVVATSYCVTRFLGEPILGPSMEPTIQHNDIIIAEKYTSSFGRHDYRRGDIVVVRSPINPHQLICKRIAAMAGDPVAGRYSHFNILRQTIVPQGHVWLLGDNKSNSTDSREFGALPIGLIIGRVVFRIWPLNRWADFRHDPLTGIEQS